jgi:hypothetical protein
MNRHQGTELVQDAPTILTCYKQHQFIQQDPEDTIALFEGSLNPASISGYTGIVLPGNRDCLFSRNKMACRETSEIFRLSLHMLTRGSSC